MSHFLRHEGCPKCGSRDNLGVWSDGHKWCFGCGYYVPAGDNIDLDAIKNRIKIENNVNNKVYLPDDFDYYIPVKAKEWLDKYDISSAEIARNHIGYSEEKELLIFPLFGNGGDLLAWQGRSFADNVKYKYFTRGDVNNILHILGEGDTLVLTEDLISAIKVARITAAMPIFGSHVSYSLLARSSRYFKNLVVWLDKDKAKEAVKYSNRARPFFDGEVRTLVTDKDPKDYTTGEIKTMLKSC